MKYTKPPLTFSQQADLLLSRGLIAQKDDLISKLKAVSYNRLSGYLFPFRNPDDSFQQGTSFKKVWDLYTFDRQLRLLILDAIERVEVSIKTNIIYLFSHTYGPFGYINAQNLPGLNPGEHAGLIAKIEEEKVRSHEPFVKHFNDKYGDSHANLPLWMAAEIMTYGMLLSHWRERLENLLDRYQNVSRKPMGFADNWKDCPIWN
jgi:abortive infection bacteriophage resistance protein